MPATKETLDEAAQQAGILAESQRTQHVCIDNSKYSAVKA